MVVYTQTGRKSLKLAKKSMEIAILLGMGQKDSYVYPEYQTRNSFCRKK